MILRRTTILAAVLVGLSLSSQAAAFAPLSPSISASTATTAGPASKDDGCQQLVGSSNSRTSKVTALGMGLDMVTYLRTEWVSAALCTNQTPRSADVCLELGCDDGRGVTFVPRTIREYWTSTIEADGVLPLKIRRQLKTSQERRKAAEVMYFDQRADDLKELANESVDVVISLQAAAKMVENGLDWKKSIDEAARVLKPGGRLLFVEPNELDGESYLDYVQQLGLNTQGDSAEGDNDGGADDENKEEEQRFAIFDDVGFDSVDLVIVPHTAGVAIKSIDAGLTIDQRNAKIKKMEQDKEAELSIMAYERGIKKRKRKKKGANKADTETTATK
mmetsp:Transcript_1661/g.4575  ORF Transcript_1661/g.4575 Transcript_1661/m.4575 type:complete len:333 (-) Transcript_1661:1451-2449(-)